MQELLNKIASVVEERNLYKEVWDQLYNAFGERMQDKEQELMDSVLQSTRLDFKERQDAIQNQTPK